MLCCRLVAAPASSLVLVCPAVAGSAVDDSLASVARGRRVLVSHGLWRHCGPRPRVSHELVLSKAPCRCLLPGGNDAWLLLRARGVAVAPAGCWRSLGVAVTIPVVAACVGRGGCSCRSWRSCFSPQPLRSCSPRLADSGSQAYAEALLTSTRRPLAGLRATLIDPVSDVSDLTCHGTHGATCWLLRTHADLVMQCCSPRVRYTRGAEPRTAWSVP